MSTSGATVRRSPRQPTDRPAPQFAAPAALTSPIVGTTKANHLEDALAGLKLTLTDDEAKALEAPYQPKPVLDHA